MPLRGVKITLPLTIYSQYILTRRQPSTAQSGVWLAASGLSIVCCFVTDSSTEINTRCTHPPQSLASPRIRPRAPEHALRPYSATAPLQCDCAPEHTLCNCDYARLRARTGAETRRRRLTGRFDVLTTWSIDFCA